MTATQRGWGAKGLALAVGLLAALALGEALLRLARPERLATIEYPCFYEPDPVLGFRYQPNAAGRVAGHFEIENEANTNSLGFYDEEPLAQGAAFPRILAVLPAGLRRRTAMRVQILLQPSRGAGPALARCNHLLPAHYFAGLSLPVTLRKALAQLCRSGQRGSAAGLRREHCDRRAFRVLRGGARFHLSVGVQRARGLT